MRSVFLALALFVFVFGWKITPYVDLISVTSLLLAVVSFVGMRATLPRAVLLLLGMLSALTLHACLVVASHGAEDLQIVLRSARATLNLLGGVGLAWLYGRVHGRAAGSRALRDLHGVIVAHGAIILVLYLFPAVREAVYAVTQASRYVNLTASFLLGLRVPGLTYGLSQTSVVQMFGIVLLWAWVRERGLGAGRVVWSGLAVILLLLSILLTGRSGLVLLLIVTPLLVLSTWRMDSRPTRPVETVRGRLARLGGLTAAATVLALFAAAAPQAFRDYNLAQALEAWRWVTDAGDTATSRALGEMLMVPEDPVTLVLGSGNLGRSQLGYLPSDIGYVRVLFAVGLVGSILLMLPFLYGIWLALKGRNGSTGVATALLVTLTASLILHGKEMALMTRNQWSVEVFLLGILLYGSERSNPAASSADPDLMAGP